MRTPASGRGPSHDKRSEKGRPGRRASISSSTGGRSGSAASGARVQSPTPADSRVRPAAPQQRPRSRGLLVAGGIVLLLLLAGGGIYLGITLKTVADANRLATSLKQAAYYEDKGAYDEALKILNGLNIDDPRVKQLLDDVLAKKKAADDAARQQELSALLAQQQQLRAGLNELGAKLTAHEAAPQ